MVKKDLKLNNIDFCSGWGKLLLTVNSMLTVEIVYNEHQEQAEFARYNRFSL